MNRLLLAGIALLPLFTAACGKNETAAASQAIPRKLTVATAHAVTRTVPASFQETGTFNPDETSDIAPLVAGRGHVDEDGFRLSAGVDAAPGLATAVVRALDAAGVLVDNIEVRQPSLDDVFFSLTGGHIEADDEDAEDEDEDGGEGGGGRTAGAAGHGSDGDGDGRHELVGARA